MEDGFWQKPPRWLVLLFGGAMLVFVASMWTWWEGRRFASRPLERAEAQIVAQALQTWQTLAPEVDGWRDLRTLLAARKVRAMDKASFGRKAERITLGYTDEWGRILLNPNICFSAYSTLGPRVCQGVQKSDLVRTMTTMHHEYHHLIRRAVESEAYAAEWNFVRVCLERSRERDDPELTAALAEWEGEMQERIRLYVGNTRFERLKENLNRSGPKADQPS